MAFTKQIKSSRLHLRVEVGSDQAGKKTYKVVSYNRIVEAASDEAVQAVGVALGSLQKYPVAEVLRVDEQVLANQ